MGAQRPDNVGQTLSMCSPVAPDLLQARVAAAVEPIQPVSQRALLVVVLVITFVALDGIEGAGSENLRDHPLVRKRRLDIVLRLLRQSTLLLRRHEYRGAIARAFVTELPRGIEWIDVDPVVIEQVLIADDARVVGDLDGFVMASVIAVVGWTLRCPAGKARDYVLNTSQPLEV